MVLDENLYFHYVNKFVSDFLRSSSAGDELIESWKSKSNVKSLKSGLRRFGAIASGGNIKPKRVVSKYLFFCDEERPKIRNEFPEMNIKEITCELGKRWREFMTNPDVDRLTRITDKFNADKSRYEDERVVKASSIGKKRRGGNKRSIGGDEEEGDQQPAAKRPPTAYLVFCGKERSITPKITMKELGEKWRDIKFNRPEELCHYVASTDDA